MIKSGYVEIAIGDYSNSVYKSLIQIIQFNSPAGIYYKNESALLKDRYIFYYPEGINEENVSFIVKSLKELDMIVLFEKHPNKTIEDGSFNFSSVKVNA